MAEVIDERWAAVDAYISEEIVGADPVLDAAIDSSAAAGLPAIQVSPPLGKLLMLLARMRQARAILEIGTLGGYSTIWLARGMAAGGKLITLEADPKHAAVARENIERAGASDRVDIRVGRAQESLPRLLEERTGPFDLIFIDADKTGYPDYFSWALQLSGEGTVIVADNVIREGAVSDAASADASVQAVRRFNELVASTPGVAATAIQTVGVKGYDGFLLAIVGGRPAS